jgi:hypothetical protein
VRRGGKGRDRGRENKKGRPLSEAPLFGVALSCVCQALCSPAFNVKMLCPSQTQRTPFGPLSGLQGGVKSPEKGPNIFDSDDPGFRFAVQREFHLESKAYAVETRVNATARANTVFKRVTESIS